MNQKKENILFLKPFEVNTSLSSFSGTWEILRKRYIKIDDVSDAYLLRSLSEDGKYGYVSCSVWKSKESFNEVIKNDVILRYHYNDYKISDTSGHNLFKNVFSSNSNSLNIRNKVISLHLFVNKKGLSNNILKNWGEFTTEIELAEGFLFSHLYKPLRRNVRFDFIGFIVWKDLESVYVAEMKNKFKKYFGNSNSDDLYSDLYTVAKRNKKK